jgi:hypothetical protein
MKTLEVFYHNQEQLDFIYVCLKRGPTQEEVIKYMENMHLHNLSSSLYERRPIEFWDVARYTNGETENRLIEAMFDFNAIVVRADEDYHNAD